MNWTDALLTWSWSFSVVVNFLTRLRISQQSLLKPLHFAIALPFLLPTARALHFPLVCHGYSQWHPRVDKIEDTTVCGTFGDPLSAESESINKQYGFLLDGFHSQHLWRAMSARSDAFWVGDAADSVDYIDSGNWSNEAKIGGHFLAPFFALLSSACMNFTVEIIFIFVLMHQRFSRGDLLLKLGLLLSMSTAVTAANRMATVNVSDSSQNPVLDAYDNAVYYPLRYGMAVGHDAASDTTYLLGGGGMQLLKLKDFVISQEVANLMDPPYNLEYLMGMGQFYTQLADTLWMITFPGTSLLTFNTRTTTFDDATGITIPTSVERVGCLASTTGTSGREYLFVTGGSGPNGMTLTDLQVYDITTEQWMSSPAPPKMNQARLSHACLVHSDVLYAIGGWFHVATIETVPVGTDLADITGGTASWETIAGAELTYPVSGLRAAAYGSMIYIAGGGWSPEGSQMANTYVYPTIIHIFDTERQTLSVDPVNALNFAANEVASIIVNGIWFLLGGNQHYPDNQNNGNSYQYLDVAPTSSPTLSPTVAPSSAPSFSPTKPPTRAPSSAPSGAPSGAPTGAPTTSPTLSPTVPPSSAPSFSPTLSPTRYPTSENSYDSFVAVNYTLGHLSTANVHRLEAPSDDANRRRRLEVEEDAAQAVIDIERLVERGYIEQPAILLEYRDFWVRFDNPLAESYTLSDSTLMLDVPSTIWCNAAECNHLISKRDDEALSVFMTDELRQYFASEKVTFSVASMDSSPTSMDSSGDLTSDTLPNVAPSPADTSLNYFFPVSLGVIGCILLCAAYSWCFNDGVCLKCPKLPGFGCHTVDDGNFRFVGVFALQLFDFLSDINLAVEIWLQPDLLSNYLLLGIAVASIVFILFPYAVNLRYASKINQLVAGNECAKMYFETSTTFYSLLVALSGSCYASMALCSSNIFGLDKFSCGLTQTEMKQLRKLRVISNTLLENIPQIIVQIVYAGFVLKSVNSAIVFAFIASILSATSTLLRYFVEREQTDVAGGGKHIIWYHLVMQISMKNVGQYGISEKQRKAIKNHKGRRKALISKLSELFSVLKQNITIARTDITNYGAILFVNHVVYASELLLMPENENSVNDGHGEGEGDAQLLPQLYLSRLFALQRHEIDQIFRAHFGLSNEFFVRQQFKLSTMKKGIWLVNQDERDIVDEYDHVQATQKMTVVAVPGQELVDLELRWMQKTTVDSSLPVSSSEPGRPRPSSTVAVQLPNGDF